MLSNIEIGAFLNFYNRSGYVLDFSTASFDSFTMQSIGVPLCQRYQMSKGKSLMAYCDDADYEDVFKLLADLLEYYELNCMELYGEDKYKPQYERCRKIMDRELGSAIKIDTPAIACVNRDYIKDIAARANRDVDNGEFDSAITKSRTLLEEVFCHAIEKKGEEPSDKGDIGKLYNRVKTLYNMHQSKDVDRRINSLLSGLEKILTAIKEMRNEASDSHGVGNRRIALEEHHARLFVNSAMTMADFILSVQKKSEDKR
ncbi:MAG: abortive infection family protein [Suilimivivens sp.]